MNGQMDDRMPDSQTTDKQILRKQLTPLESDTGQAAGQLGTHGFCTIAWRSSLGHFGFSCYLFNCLDKAHLYQTVTCFL